MLILKPVDLQRTAWVTFSHERSVLEKRGDNASATDFGLAVEVLGERWCHIDGTVE